MEVLRLRFKIYEKKMNKKLYACIQDMELEQDIFKDVFDLNVKIGNGPGSSDGDNIPSQVVLGVTMALCGVALMFTPLSVLGLPALEVVGWDLFFAGSIMAAQKVCDENDSRNYSPEEMRKNHGMKLIPY